MFYIHLYKVKWKVFYKVGPYWILSKGYHMNISHIENKESSINYVIHLGVGGHSGSPEKSITFGRCVISLGWGG